MVIFNRERMISSKSEKLILLPIGDVIITVMEMDLEQFLRNISLRKDSNGAMCFSLISKEYAKILRCFTTML